MRPMIFCSMRWDVPRISVQFGTSQTGNLIEPLTGYHQQSKYDREWLTNSIA
jgi:hypothetical protein